MAAVKGVLMNRLMEDLYEKEAGQHTEIWSFMHDLYEALETTLMRRQVEQVRMSATHNLLVLMTDLFQQIFYIYLS